MREEPNLEPGINPCCGYITNSCDTLPDFGDSLPNVGDINLCLNCGTILIYTKAGTSNVTRLATRRDLESLNAHQRRILSKTQKYIFRRGPIYPTPGLS